MATSKTEPNKMSKLWQRTAKSRLYFELGGLAFALKKRASPEEYARHLWGKGATRWMGKARPDAQEYLLKEAEAFRCFYPDVASEVVEAGEEVAELIFTGGCLGGWGEDPWALARSFGLVKADVCSYCRESFLVWAEQLGLIARIGPNESGTCRLRVVKS